MRFQSPPGFTSHSDLLWGSYAANRLFQSPPGFTSHSDIQLSRCSSAICFNPHRASQVIPTVSGGHCRRSRNGFNPHRASQVIPTQRCYTPEPVQSDFNPHRASQVIPTCKKTRSRTKPKFQSPPGFTSHSDF